MQSTESGDLIIDASVARHLALAPVAFAVTEGNGHRLIYANAAFSRLHSDGEIGIGEVAGQEPSATDLKPLLDQVSASGRTMHDIVLTPTGAYEAAWSCTVWPVPGARLSNLVIEIRDVRLVEGAKMRQRAVAERLLLSALREQDAALHAVSTSERALYLARASRDLSMSLDEEETRNTVRQLTLPRPGTWCIVDIIESNGSIYRLAVLHPDPDKQELARQLEDQWPVQPARTAAKGSVRRTQPSVVTHESGAALVIAAHGEENLRILREIGFGSLLVVPLIVRGRVQGAMTFVSPQGDPPFSTDEIALARDVGARCAMALDNARLYREADALRVAAQEANKTRTEFLSSMSHELRTPLNAIGGFTELMAMGVQGPITEEQRVALARIKKNEEHLLTMITEILNFVRIESGRMEYRYTKVSLNEAVRDVVDMLGPAIHEKGLEVVRPSQDLHVLAWADPDRVIQIVMNLIMNAVKYTPLNGGTITLTVGESRECVFVCVRDTGPGIAVEKLEAIFEPFVQLSSGLAERRGGVGLGLAICRDLARAMHGDVTVKSEEGAGCLFTLTLPNANSSTHGVSVPDPVRTRAR